MIGIIQKPRKYAPSENPSILQVGSNDIFTIRFLLEIKEAVTGNIIASQALTIRPDLLNGSVLDVSRLVKDFVKFQVSNAQDQFIVPITKSILKYKIKLTEQGKVDGVWTDLSVNEPADIFTIWEAEIDRYNFATFVYTRFIITESVKAKFLTYKPNGSKVNDLSTEQLYFMHENSDGLYATIQTYDANNTMLHEYSAGVLNLGTYQMYRLQVSPKTLKQTMSVDFANVKYYEVFIADEDGVDVTERRRYYYENSPCNVAIQNLLWVNSLGGLDSYQFVNVEEKNSINRTTIRKNPFAVVNDLYVERDGNVLNPTEQVIDVQQEGNYTAHSQFITDNESAWLNELFKSKQVYVELADNNLVPVIVTDTNYQIQKQRVNKSGFNQTQVSYRLNGEMIPSGTNAIGGTFANKERVAYIRRNNCELIDDDMIGAAIPYGVPANTYFSEISQEYADALADMEVYIVGQGFVNNNYTCNYYYQVMITPTVTVESATGDDDYVSVHFNSNYNMEEGVTIHYEYSLNGGTTWLPAGGTGYIEHNENISPEYAIGNVAEGSGINVQARITSVYPEDTNHYVVLFAGSTHPRWYNKAKTAYYLKDNCVSGTGSPVAYTVAGGTYMSYISQEDADAQASEDIRTHAQAYANAHGTCL